MAMSVTTVTTVTADADLPFSGPKPLIRQQSFTAPRFLYIDRPGWAELLTRTIAPAVAEGLVRANIAGN